MGIADMHPSPASTAAVPDGSAATVELTVDDERYVIECAPETPALRAIRELAGHPRPRRGCQEGICGKCESSVDGVETRLCVTPIAALHGRTVVTPAPRRSIWS
jgi:aerobic-type carbon monoxide dehydrogenase small subunit (CoxS/CutS family)